MILNGPSRLILEVDPKAFLAAPQNRNNLHYLLDRLFQGNEIAEGELLSWGVKIEKEGV
jgi:hypothetical protein